MDATTDESRIDESQIDGSQVDGSFSSSLGTADSQIDESLPSHSDDVGNSDVVSLGGCTVGSLGSHKTIESHMEPVIIIGQKVAFKNNT
jgi:hypothetical protein